MRKLFRVADDEQALDPAIRHFHLQGGDQLPLQGGELVVHHHLGAQEVSEADHFFHVDRVWRRCARP